MTKEGFKDLILSLEQLFDVIRCTQAVSGCVYFADEDGFGLAANLALASLMEMENMYLYQAIIQLKRIRPGIRLSKSFIELLLIWHDKRIKIGVKLQNLFPQRYCPKLNLRDPTINAFTNVRVAQANYRCVCSRIFFVVKPRTNAQYALCNCVVSDEYGKTLEKGYVDCPTTSCRTLLNYYNSIYGLKLDRMLYLYVDASGVISNWERNTQSVVKISEYPYSENSKLQFRSVDETRAPLYRIPIKDDWRLFYCALCGAPTHYVRVRKGKTQLCVIANFSNK